MAVQCSALQGVPARPKLMSEGGNRSGKDDFKFLLGADSLSPTTSFLAAAPAAGEMESRRGAGSAGGGGGQRTFSETETGKKGCFFFLLLLNLPPRCGGANSLERT